MAMLALMERDPRAHSDDPQDQVRGFFGEGLPEGRKAVVEGGVDLADPPRCRLCRAAGRAELHPRRLHHRPGDGANKAFLPELADASRRGDAAG